MKKRSKKQTDAASKAELVIHGIEPARRSPKSGHGSLTSGAASAVIKEADRVMAELNDENIQDLYRRLEGPRGISVRSRMDIGTNELSVLTPVLCKNSYRRNWA